MPIIMTLAVGEAARIDRTDIWTLQAVFEGGTAAEFVDPSGRTVLLRQAVPFRAGPGLHLSVLPADQPGSIRLVVDAYIPLVLRHPPRDHRRTSPVQDGGR